MKKYFAFVMLLFAVILSFSTAFAAEIVSVAPDASDTVGIFIQHALGVIQMIPGIGEYAVIAFQVIAAIGGIFTILSVAAIGVLKVPYLAAKFSGAEELAYKIQKLTDKVTPYLKYFSIFNVQKKK